MREFIKEVARGKRGSKDLSFDQAYQAAEKILTGEATPVQVGAFLAAERIKMETTEEMLGFVRACEARSERYPMAGSIDSAGPYTGRAKSFYATLPAAFVLSASGLPAVLHGSQSLPPKLGVTLIDILKEVGVNIELTSKEQLIQGAEKAGFMFVPTEEWCPSLGSIRQLRHEMGVRTVFNTVEKVLRFTEAPYLALGVFHGTVFDKVAELLIELGVRRGLIIQGVEGSEDVSVEKRTRVILVEHGTHEMITVDPEELGMQAEYPETEWTVQKQAETMLYVLQGKADPAYRNMVLLNSGIRLWLAEKATTIPEGIEQAREVLDSGAAWNRFNIWAEAVKQ